MNKTKKIIAGACLGLVGMGCLAGCDSKINIDQQALNNAITQTNDYFEMQNNYTSDVAENVLMQYLALDMENSREDAGFQYKKTFTYYSQFGEKISERTEIDYKSYLNQETKVYKFFAEYYQGNCQIVKYQEIQQTIEDDEQKYKTKNYTNYAYDGVQNLWQEEVVDHYAQINMFDYDGFLADYPVHSVEDVCMAITNILMSIKTPNCSTYYSMNKIDDETMSFGLVSNMFDAESEEFYVSRLNIEFKNGKISSLTINTGLAEEEHGLLKYTFSRLAEDFTFDASSYVQA
ncbi:MAG: hypothetical protein IJW59_01635 [Clostridia bacterium]|nr:hypothetical protein [Clostridia bacterium]